MMQHDIPVKRWVAGVLSALVFSGATGTALGHDSAENQNVPPQTVSVTENTASQQNIRETRTMTLPNGLDVLLIHEPNADYSAASIAVGVGMLNDPPDMPGLAHYTEHMLFLGTEKFPETGSYDSFLTAHGGYNNAYTTSDETNYHFQIQHNAFEGALDRFSDFFKAPLFNTSYAASEVKNIDEEFNRNLRNDYRRSSYIKKLLSKPDHPLASFGTGNKNTLGGGYNQDALQDFFNHYYSAKNMKLAMISNLSLDKQEALAKKHFSSVPSFDVEPPAMDSDYRPSLENKYRLLEIEAIIDTKEMTLSFPTIQLDDYKKSAPGDILSSILGYKGKGSLLSKLKQEGLAKELYAGASSYHQDLHEMSIRMALTSKGMKEQNRILELVFSYIEMLKEQHVQDYSFKEKKALYEISHRWQAPREGNDYIAALSSLMLNYDPDDVLTTPFLISDYEPEAYQKLLETLTPENMLVTILAQGLKTDKTAPYYGTEYAITEIGGVAFEKLKNPPKAQDENMTYPAENPFVPYHLKLQPQDTETSWHQNRIHPVISNDTAVILSQFDTKFNIPRVNMSLWIETPRTSDSVRSYILSRLLDNCISESLNEQTYPMLAAGTNYNIQIEHEAVRVDFGGYTKNLDKLVTLVAKNMTACHIDDATFENLKNNMRNNILNSQQENALDRTEYFSEHLFESLYSDEDKINALQKATLADVQEFALKLFENARITGTAYGNWNDKDVRYAANSFIKQLKAKPLPKNDRGDPKTEYLMAGEDIIFSTRVPDNNNALLYMIQAGHASRENRAALTLLNSIVSSDFYTQLRTNQQLGYTVYSNPKRNGDYLFLQFNIRSRYDPSYVQDAVQKWIKTALPLINRLTDQDFEIYKETFARKYEESEDSIKEQNDRIFALTVFQRGDFEFHSKMAAIIRNLTRQDINDLATKLFEDSSTPTLSIQIRANDNHQEPPKGAYKTIEDFKNRFAVPGV